MQVTHEISDLHTGFKHRVKAMDGSMPRVGNWFPFQLPAVLTLKDVTYVAVTDYWKDVAPFPNPAKIYVVKEKV